LLCRRYLALSSPLLPYTTLFRSGRFFDDDLEGLLDGARSELAAFLGGDPENLAFVQNATTVVNTVLRSLRFATGDELLTTNHEYDRKSARLNSSHQIISYAVYCL